MSRSACSPRGWARPATRQTRSAAPSTGCAPKGATPNRSLYDNNRCVYSLLRYGVPVKNEAGKVTETVKLIDWAQPLANGFAIAEEVMLRAGLGGHERRPDLVLYVNGIAVRVTALMHNFVLFAAELTKHEPQRV